jgi:DNA mismatch repair protein MutL
MLSSALEKKDSVKSDVHSNMALTMARSAAVVVGQVLSNEEMNAIVSELLACPMPNYTPDGKKIICIIDEQEFSKMFS